MSQNNWNRWGPEDERGALNHIGSDEIRAAAGLVRSGQVLSLAQTLSPRTPVPEHRAGVQHFMGRDGGDYAAGARRPGGFQFAEDTVVLPLHIGTHIDALCHAWYDDALYNGFPGDGTRSNTGASRCGIDKMGPITGRGVLLDVAAMHGAPLEDGVSIGAAELEQAVSRAGVRVGKGDIVLIRTGWPERAGAKSFNAEPGLNVEAGLWLAERIDHWVAVLVFHNRLVGQCRIFKKRGDRVEAEARHAAFQPEADDVLEGRQFLVALHRLGYWPRSLGRPWLGGFRVLRRTLLHGS